MTMMMEVVVHTHCISSHKLLNSNSDVYSPRAREKVHTTDASLQTI